MRVESRLLPRFAGCLLGQKIVVQSKQSQLQAVADPQLVEDIGQVALDGFFANAEGLRDVLVGASFGNQADDLELACRQAKGLAWRRSGLRGEIAQHLDKVLYRTALQPVLPLHHGANASGEVIDNGVLQNNATGTELQSLQNLTLVDESSEDNGARVGRIAGQFAQRIHARHPRHRQVEKQDVGTKRAHHV